MELRPANFPEILRLLRNAGVDFVLIGGGAALAHGSAYVTYDVDVVYRRSPENLECLVAALKPHNPYLRGAPPGLPFRWDAETIGHGLNFTLTTDLGDLDLLGYVTGGGTYEDLVDRSIEIEAFGVHFLCVDLPKLIDLKRAAGRSKDLAILAELYSLLEETDPDTPQDR
ncbi:MAG: nucleotidyltransferase [Planctomycetaceae bacterium]